MLSERRWNSSNTTYKITKLVSSIYKLIVGYMFNGMSCNIRIHFSMQIIGGLQVERVATLYNIDLRTGCVCNPGACQSCLHISSSRLMKQHQVCVRDTARTEKNVSG